MDKNVNFILVYFDFDFFYVRMCKRNSINQLT